MIEIYIRPLINSDAHVSFNWRNDPKVWQYTKFIIKEPITYKIERKWLEETLGNESNNRFAICISSTNQYVGNVQLLDIEQSSANFHIFIGEKEFWGKGIGHQATLLMIKHGFHELKLKKIFLEVHSENKSAFSIYSKIGFKTISANSEFIKMVLYSDQIASKFLSPKVKTK
jgi:diamine N-acetyltransferase